VVILIVGETQSVSVCACTYNLHKMQIPTLMKSYVACQYPLTSGKYIFTEKQLHCFSTTYDYNGCNLAVEGML